MSNAALFVSDVESEIVERNPFKRLAMILECLDETLDELALAWAAYPANSELHRDKFCVMDALRGVADSRFQGVINDLRLHPDVNRGFSGELLEVMDDLRSVTEKSPLDEHPYMLMLKRLEESNFMFYRRLLPLLLPFYRRLRILEPMVPLSIVDGSPFTGHWNGGQPILRSFAMARGIKLSPANSSTRPQVDPTKGEWSDPMSKTELMTRLKLKPDGFETFCKTHPLKRLSRQLWQIRLNDMDVRTRNLILGKKA